MNESRAKPGAGWFPKAVIAAMLGVKVQTVDKIYRPLLPDTALLKHKGKVYFNAPALIKAIVAAEQAKAAKPDLTDEALLSGEGDSEWLEALRKESALLKRMDRQEREATHVNLADMHNALMRFANTLRKAGEVLQRRWGNDASDLYNEALDSAVAQIVPDGSPDRKQN